MYEFDEDGWDEQETSEADLWNGVSEGWLIQRVEGDSRISDDRPMFLQIGTGQWCGAEYATLFPLRSTAIVYAEEFGYVVGRSVQIVKHRF